MILLKKSRLFFISVVLLMQGCAVSESRYSSQLFYGDGTKSMRNSDKKMVLLGKTTTTPLSLIATDFVQSLAQVPDAGGYLSTIATRKYKSGFERMIISSLIRRGYNVADNAQQANGTLLKTSTVASESDPTELTFTLELGDLAMQRTYIVDQNYVRPVSGLRVRGIATDLIALDDRKFVEPSRM